MIYILPNNNNNNKNNMENENNNENTQNRMKGVTYIKKGTHHSYHISTQENNETNTLKTRHDYKNNNSFVEFCKYIIMPISFPILFVSFIFQK